MIAAVMNIIWTRGSVTGLIDALDCNNDSLQINTDDNKIRIDVLKISRKETVFMYNGCCLYLYNTTESLWCWWRIN